MRYLTRLDSIRSLYLSTRAYNALCRAGINNIGDLLDFPREDFASLKNIGNKTIIEITEVINQIKTIVIDPLNTNPEQNTEYDGLPQFIGKDGKSYIDLPIENINLSKRSFNCLKGAGIDYISKLLDKTEIDLFKIRNMGIKSVTEIIQVLSQLVLQPASPVESTYNNSDFEINKFCRCIVQEIYKTINVPADQLFKDILQLAKHNNYKFSQQSSEIDEQVISELYKLPLLRQALKESLLKQLESTLYGLDKLNLVRSMPIFMQNESLVDGLLSELIQEGNLLRLHTNIYIRKYPTVLQYVESLSNPQYNIVLTERLYGQTLADIGKQLNITRERVRQIESKCLRKMPTLREDLYARVFKKYDISKEHFILGFKESETTYNYLSIAYKKGICPIDELAADTDFPDYFKKAAERIIYKNYVVLGGEHIFCSRSELCEYILRTSGSEGLTFEELVQYYQMLLEDLNLQDNPKPRLFTTVW